MKFRGKRIDNGEWVEGDIHWGKYYRTAHIHPVLGSNFSDNVYPESVSMSTIQKDKNGVEIFGSIPVDGKITKGGDIIEYGEYKGIISYDCGTFFFKETEPYSDYDKYEIDLHTLSIEDGNIYKVTGNQYEED